MKKVKSIILLGFVLFTVGCSNQNTGTLVGATSGLLIGSTGGPVTAGIGLGVGALAGVAAGTAIDKISATDAKTADTPATRG